MSFSPFPPTQRPPTTIILAWKWSQEQDGSYKTQIKKSADFDQKIIEVAIKKFRVEKSFYEILWCLKNT